MIIEIERSMLLREPRVELNRPHNSLVANVRPEIPGASTLTEQVCNGPPVNTFRVIDVRGPVYEFQGTASFKNDLLFVSMTGSLKPLR